MKTQTLEERYWPKVDKSEDCWIWIAGKDRNGYGCFWDGERLVNSHRMAWRIANGPIPGGMQINHTCDNRPCVNPDHLYLGTQKENIRDMYERKGLKTLSREQVMEAYHSKEKQRDMAKRFGVSKSFIGNIRRGETLSWITQAS